MKVLFPGGALVDDDDDPHRDDPFIGGRSEKGGKWRVVARLQMSQDKRRIFVSELDVSSWDGSAQHLGTDDLRRIPLGTWLATAHDAMVSAEAKGRTRRNAPGAGPVRSAQISPRKGRRGFGDAYYREVALLYLELQSAGKLRNVHWQISELSNERLGRHRFPDQIRDDIHGATTRGFLMKGTPGRAGRFPGPKLNTGEGDPP